MRTRRQTYALAATVVLLGLLAGFVASGVTGTAPSIPAELAARGVSFEAAANARVTPEEAIRIASDRAGSLVTSATTQALLVTATDPMLATAEAAIASRKVWVVQFSGLSAFIPGPVGADGKEAKGHTIHKGFAYVDADTGEWLATVWSE